MSPRRHLIFLEPRPKIREILLEQIVVRQSVDVVAFVTSELTTPEVGLAIGQSRRKGENNQRDEGVVLVVEREKARAGANRRRREETQASIKEGGLGTEQLTSGMQDLLELLIQKTGRGRRLEP